MCFHIWVCGQLIQNQYSVNLIVNFIFQKYLYMYLLLNILFIDYLFVACLYIINWLFRFLEKSYWKQREYNISEKWHTDLQCFYYYLPLMYNVFMLKLQDIYFISQMSVLYSRTSLLWQIVYSFLELCQDLCFNTLDMID